MRFLQGLATPGDQRIALLRVLELSQETLCIEPSATLCIQGGLGMTNRYGHVGPKLPLDMLDMLDCDIG